MFQNFNDSLTEWSLHLQSVSTEAPHKAKDTLLTSLFHELSTYNDLIFSLLKYFFMIRQMCSRTHSYFYLISSGCFQKLKGQSTYSAVTLRF